MLATGCAALGGATGAGAGFLTTGLLSGTPVQTAVKREDEQAFARLNAENLMFCEDAARRVAAALSADPRIQRFDAEVAHFESLHAHDAVARVTGQGAAE